MITELGGLSAKDTGWLFSTLDVVISASDPLAYFVCAVGLTIVPDIFKAWLDSGGGGGLDWGPNASSLLYMGLLCVSHKSCHSFIETGKKLR